jgi:D-alanine-D-alanine ligase
MLRVDVIIDKDDKVWVLEGNTLPGCTPSSLLPKAARAAGISFPEMCSSLAFAAANRE